MSDELNTENQISQPENIQIENSINENLQNENLAESVEFENSLAENNENKNLVEDSNSNNESNSSLNLIEENDQNSQNSVENLNEDVSIDENSSEENVKTEEYQIHTLRVSSLYKSFGKKKVVRGIDFSMKTGEVLGLLGPNGAGKTTTFYMVVGFYKPTQGEVFLDEERVTNLPMFKRAQKGISYLPQEPSVFKKMTVEDNIWSIIETRRDLTRAQKKDLLEELIDEFAIARIRRQKAYTLSGGERRRTEIARSLAIQPKFLMLDEPFAGIDPIAVADIKNLIKLLSKRGIGILITDHNVRDTLEITTRSIIVSSGQIITQGSKEEILQSELARKIYLGSDFNM